MNSKNVVVEYQGSKYVVLENDLKNERFFCANPKTKKFGFIAHKDAKYLGFLKEND